MENSHKEVMLHSQFLENLFAFKKKVSNVFRDVLGIHDIHHIALTRINKHNQLLTLSSTPAMEFNLFNSFLWKYDQTYNPKWFKLCTQQEDFYKIGQYCSNLLHPLFSYYEEFPSQHFIINSG
ncbi:TPA: hypothetical protein JBJ33_04490 [Legionella pneumophila]|nr:hypothetical protein [Legionella pneumophila]HAU1683281.1 hypothetical protein [Legionella pneumophila]